MGSAKNMKLILRADVENLGRLGEIVKVKPGYGRNFLVPQGLAMAATDSNLKVFELERRKLQEREDALRGTAKALAERVNETVVSIVVRVGEGDKLYGSVTSQMIVDAAAELGLELDRRKLDLESPIRALGEYSVPVKLHPDIVSELQVHVVKHDLGLDAVEPQAAEEPAAQAEQAEESGEQAADEQPEPAEETEA
jgi:large subunit ribosomal protein L9